jgi:hypothetical protein
MARYGSLLSIAQLLSKLPFNALKAHAEDFTPPDQSTRLEAKKPPRSMKPTELVAHKAACSHKSHGSDKLMETSFFKLSLPAQNTQRKKSPTVKDITHRDVVS